MGRGYNMQFLLYRQPLGRSPHRTNLYRNLHGDCRPDVMTCAKFQTEIFREYVLQGVELLIFLLILAWALQQ